MLLLAADHTSRGRLSIGSDPKAAADRRQLLGRIMTGRLDSRVDGRVAAASKRPELLSVREAVARAACLVHPTATSPPQESHS